MKGCDDKSPIVALKENSFEKFISTYLPERFVQNEKSNNSSMVSFKGHYKSTRNRNKCMQVGGKNALFYIVNMSVSLSALQTK